LTTVDSTVDYKTDSPNADVDCRLSLAIVVR